MPLGAHKYGSAPHRQHCRYTAGTALPVHCRYTELNNMLGTRALLASGTLLPKDGVAGVVSQQWLSMISRATSRADCTKRHAAM